MSNYLELFKQVRDRREMYIQLGFESLEGFFVGFDLGNSGGILRGFREWLEMKVDGGDHHLRWSALVVDLTFPEADEPEAVLHGSPEADEAACVELFELFKAFHDQTCTFGGLKRVYLDHQEWLRTRDGMGPSRTTGRNAGAGRATGVSSGIHDVIACGCLELFAHIREHRQLYISRSYDALESLFMGFDMANEGGVLRGFGEWLTTQLGFGDNLSWGLKALYLAFPEAEDPNAARRDSPDAQEVACLGLFDLVDEFVRYRREMGLEAIFRDYQAWLRKQAWYGPDFGDHWYESGTS